MRIKNRYLKLVLDCVCVVSSKEYNILAFITIYLKRYWHDAVHGVDDEDKVPDHRTLIELQPSLICTHVVEHTTLEKIKQYNIEFNKIL